MHIRAKGTSPMPGPAPPRVELTARQREVLEQITRGQTSPQRLVRRAQILLHAAAGRSSQQIVNQLALTHATVRVWRRRWRDAAARLTALEAEEPDDRRLREHLEALLRDAPRSGAPDTFSPEQIIEILAVACEDPQACGHPISHWTPSALAREVIHRQIVPSISSRQVGRFLKGSGDPTPSQSLLAANDARGPGSF